MYYFLQLVIFVVFQGFIDDDKKAIDLYKKEHSKNWLAILGTDSFDIVEEDEMEENIKDIPLDEE